MALTQINGATQIRAGTVPLSVLVTGYSVPTANLAQGSLFIQSTGTVAMGAALNLGGFAIQNLASPTNATDAASKSYVDALINGFKIHGAVVVSVTNIATLSTLPTIDGVTLTAGQVALLTAQTTGSQNGPWVVASGSWTRPTWWAAASTIAEGNYFIIDPDGTTYKNTKWFVTTIGNITVDTTSIAFVQDLSGTVYSAGSGLLLTGATFSAVTGNGVTVTSNQITAVGNATNLITVGASGIGITTGTAASLILGNASGVPTWTAMSGDVTISNAGVTTISTNTSTGYLKYANTICNETPSGALNGSNTTYTLANTPAVGSVELFYEGILQQPGAGNDYTISGATITMLFAPATGDKLIVSYNK